MFGINTNEKSLNEIAKWPILFLLFIGWLVFIVIYPSYGGVKPAADSQYSYEIIKFVSLSTSAFGVLFSALLTSFNSLEASLVHKDLIGDYYF